MDARPSISTLTEALELLSVGERLWFWFCPDLDMRGPQLLMTGLATDAGMARLNAQVDAVALPVGARSHRGLASVGTDGRLRFAAPGLSAQALQALAAWADRNVLNHPGLSHLKGAEMFDITPEGTVSAIHADPGLWANLAEPIVQGTPGGTADTINALEAGEDAWFWASDAGYGGRPAMIAVAAEIDPDGALLNGQLQALRGTGAQVRGVLRWTEDRRLVITSTSPIDDLVDVLSAIVYSFGAMRSLAGARLLQVAEGGIVAAGNLPGVEDLDAYGQLVKRARGGEGAWFWFTTADEGGSPRLLLGDSKAALKSLSAPIVPLGSVLRGQLGLDEDGTLSFISRGGDADGVLVSLARWTADAASVSPQLRALRGARLTIVGDDGEVVSRHDDDAVWTLV